MRQVLRIASYEILHILRDRLLCLMVFVVPLAYALVFGLTYLSGVVTNVPLGVVDLSNSQLSREIVTAFENSPNFQVVKNIETYQQLEQAMNNNIVRAGIVIPEDLATSAVQHRNTKVLTIYDASNLLLGFNIKKYTLEVLAQFNAKHTAAYLAGMGFTAGEIKNTLSTVSTSINPWYNPTYNYATFMLPGLLLMVIHQIGLLACALTVTREKESNSWVQFLCTTLPRWKIFVGKTLPYFVANYANFWLLFAFAHYFFHIKVLGSLLVLALLALLFNIIITGLAFFISVYAPNSLQITRYLMLISVPIFMVSGFTWPSSHIPAPLNLLADLLPYTWMSKAFRMVTMKELGLQYIAIPVLVLTFMAVLAVILAIRFNKYRQPRSRGGLSVNCGTDYPGRK